MKNAMKKLFSLLLVAVLLVGVMPFQASADNVPYYQIISPSEGDKPLSEATGLTAGTTYDVSDFPIPSGYQFDYATNNGAMITLPITAKNGDVIYLFANPAPTHEHSYDDGVVTTKPTCTTEGVKTYTCGCGETYTEPVAATGHTAGDEATCTTAQTCTDCGETLAAALDHDVVDGKCTRSGCDYTEDTTEQEPVHADIRWEIKNVAGGDVVNSGSFTPNGETAVAKDILYYHVFNKTTAWKEQYTVDKVYSSKAGDDVGYYGEIPAGDTVTFVLTPVDDSDDSDDSDKTPSIPSGSHSLNVWARIWVGEKRFDTRLLDTIDNLSGKALIYQVVAANINRLESKFPAGFHYLHWYENVYHKNEDNEYEVVNTALTVGDEDDIYVNLYSEEKLVVVNVHTSKSYAYDLSVRVEGFRVGDTVTYNDVLNAVKKYYNVSSMKIFTYEEMERYIAGKDANKTQNFIVKAGDSTDGDNTYEVFITGSRKSGTYTYTADSSNPKTGDAIFAPMIVLGASATCLAVLFFLNKKRAY